MRSCQDPIPPAMSARSAPGVSVSRAYGPTSPALTGRAEQVQRDGEDVVGGDRGDGVQLVLDGAVVAADQLVLADPAHLGLAVLQPQDGRADQLSLGPGDLLVRSGRHGRRSVRAGPHRPPRRGSRAGSRRRPRTTRCRRRPRSRCNRSTPGRVPRGSPGTTASSSRRPARSTTRASAWRRGSVRPRARTPTHRWACSVSRSMTVSAPARGFPRTAPRRGATGPVPADR